MLLIIVFGFLFGAVLQFSKLNRYNTISGMSMLRDLTMAKAIAVAIGLGIIFVNIEIALGFASYHVKPLLVGGIILGGLIFGAGMSILGYCPGTIPVSMGEGSVDAFSGFVGAVVAGIVYTVIVPSIKGILGPDAGQAALVNLFDKPGPAFFIIIVILGAFLVYAAFFLNRFDKDKSYRWLVSGIGIAIITAGIFLTTVFDRVLGASGFYPFIGDKVAGLTETEYYKGIAGSGKWEMFFLAGAFLSGLVLSLIRGDFRFTLIHDNWRKYKNNSSGSRLVWSFVGGFLLIIGARLAGGCTSGHIISGGMQIAFSSWIFAAVVFGSFLLTGRLFYKRL
ncbi:MAG TPA: YeeE/YedE thiosulfate transporter family protein [Bacteroidales bacterium]|nr:YeeE/YedE thiosulfate transporter family protein [Bacteroidales bacterium]